MPVYFEFICRSPTEVAGNSVFTRLIPGRTDGHTLVFDSWIVYRI